MDYNTVHIAFGFHVNCYHSYRGDTNDAAGFASDLRIMRHTIENLDGWNARGIPVKGTWDFENAYSLEEILPVYAPDIISNVRRRCQENGDENILMGYNNGAMSAMTKDEFLASISLAVSNPKGSGLKDLFGSYAPIIRPQEVMFTPCEAELYAEAGIKAVCIYYSCVPFDGFRTIIPQLDDEYAFNPLTYQWHDSSIVILPTYSQSDLMDAGSLRYLACSLHKKQEAGKINHDVFLFINIDADSFLWEPLAAPKWIQKIPNCGGLNGLIEEVYGLDFIRFDTPNGYLEKHLPLKTVRFEEDIADGNFSGYASWAEKPFNRTVWTRLERARRMAEFQHLDAGSASFDSRIRLLSTTHFGLASPVLNITREEKALSLSARMVEEEMHCFPSQAPLTLQASRKQSLFACQLQLQTGYCKEITSLVLKNEDVDAYTLMPMRTFDDGSIATMYLTAHTKNPVTELVLHFEIDPSQPRSAEKTDVLCAGGLTLQRDASGFPVLMHGGKQAAIIESYLTYDDRRVPFSLPAVSAIPVGGQGKGIRYEGEIHLKDELHAGHYRYDFVQSDAADLLIMDCEIQYPYTREMDSISTSASSLGRFSDRRWKEAVPFAMRFAMDDTVHLTKRSFMGSISDYPCRDFWESMPANQNIDSFNQQLTGGLLYLGDQRGGFALAHARMVSSSMAHCPMRLRTVEGIRQVTMNPFGTYFGRQRTYPTRTNGCVMDLYNMTMPQAQSLAPAYNGAHEEFVMSAAWTENGLSAEMTDTLCTFADGVTVCGGQKITACTMDNSTPHAPEAQSHDARHMKGFSSYSSSKMHLAGTVLSLIHQIRRSQAAADQYLDARSKQH